MKSNPYRIKLIIAATAIFIAGVAIAIAGTSPAQAGSAAFPDPPVVGKETGIQTALFAGGCFWGVEGVFERLRGVTDAVSGYAGGTTKNPSYEQVATGRTGHAESVLVTYDPSLISYGTLLKVFFSVAHDPTQLNYQGPDQGTQYRSAIFYKSDLQKKTTEAYVKSLGAARVFPAPIVTQIVAYEAFYPAEDYHQHFLDNNPTYPYIVYWDMPKIAALNASYPSLVAKK
jgi:peptide-methionine (S)-S-oxide reductase